MLFMASEAFAKTASQEKRGLEKLYEATHGANWIRATNWLQGDPCADKWHGVMCDKAKAKVTGINLFNNALSGTIPSELGHITGLTGLSFRINTISGTVPSELGRLTALKGIGLYNNRLSGTLPTQLALLSPTACWLNYAQCVTTLEHESCSPTENRNSFSCPLPALSGACAAPLGIDCEEEEEEVEAASPSPASLSLPPPPATLQTPPSSYPPPAAAAGCTGAKSLPEWLLSCGGVHAKIVDRTIATLEAEDVFDVSDLYAYRKAGLLYTNFKRLTADKIAAALDADAELSTAGGARPPAGGKVEL